VEKRDMDIERNTMWKEKGNHEGRRRRKEREMGVNMFKVPDMHVWKYHN
jgi:hypothetical protein